MARDLFRTAADERADAWEKLAALLRELPNVQAHLEHADDGAAALWQAARSARIVANTAVAVAVLAERGARRAEQEEAAPDLKSVS